MKHLLHLGAAILFAAAASAATLADLTISDPAHAGSRLFDSTPGFTITGLAADSSGDVFYIESDSFNYSANATLYRRSASDGYASATPIFDLGPGVFGSFVISVGGRVVFGESSTNAIRAINPDGTGLDLLGTVPNNYDAAFSGGSLYLSHNVELNFFNPPKNRVSKFDLIADGAGGLMLAAADTILAFDGDYSGPLEFAAGALFYGASGYGSVQGLYHYSAAEVAAAIGPGVFTRDDHLFSPNGANTALAYEPGAGLWQDSFSGALLLYDPANATVRTIGSTSASLGHLEFAADALFVNVTNFSTAQSSVFIVVPEPSAALLLLAALPVFARRRR